MAVAGSEALDCSHAVRFAFNASLFGAAVKFDRE